MSILRKWRLILIAIIAPILLSACTLPWQNNSAGLQVTITDGTQAQVFLNDLHLGSAPIDRQDLKIGVYRMRIVPDASTGKQPYETEIRLYPSALTTVLWSFTGSDPTGHGDILELEPLSTKERAELSVITVPEGATVSLNSTTYGLSPVILDSIDPGEYTLTVSAVGHSRKTFSTRVTKGYRLHAFSRLERDGGALAESESTPEESPDATASAIILDDDAPPAPRPTPVPSPGVATPSPTPLTPPYVTITDTGTGWLRVRDQASSAGQEITRVDVGTSHPYISTLNGWYEIEYEPGKAGWISGQFANIVR